MLLWIRFDVLVSFPLNTEMCVWTWLEVSVFVFSTRQKCAAHLTPFRLQCFGWNAWKHVNPSPSIIQWLSLEEVSPPSTFISVSLSKPLLLNCQPTHVFFSNLSSGLCGHVRFTRLRPVWHCGRTRKYHTSSGLLTSVGGVGRCGQAVCSLCITESCGVMRRKPAGYQNVIFTFIPNQCNHYVLFFKTKNKSPNWKISCSDTMSLFIRPLVKKWSNEIKKRKIKCSVMCVH